MARRERPFKGWHFTSDVLLWAVRQRVARMHKIVTEEIQLKQYVSLQLILRRNLV